MALIASSNGMGPFGMPAENAAKQNNQDPKANENNIAQ